MKLDISLHLCRTTRLLIMVTVLASTSHSAIGKEPLPITLPRIGYVALSGALYYHLVHSFIMKPTDSKARCILAGTTLGLNIRFNPRVQQVIEQDNPGQFLFPLFFALAIVRPHNLLEKHEVLDNVALFAGSTLLGIAGRARLGEDFFELPDGIEDDIENDADQGDLHTNKKRLEKSGDTPEQLFTFANIAGKVPQDVREVVDLINNGQAYETMGARMPKGILLVGPPGTGKTSIVRAIAGEVKAKFIYRSGTDFIDKWVGTGPKRIRKLFDEARSSIKSGKYSKAIIFIDELDAIGSKRSGGHGGDNEYRATINELLNQLDGFKKDPHVFILAATNMLEDLDTALTRAGRFDRIVTIGLPDAESREAILRLYLKDVVADEHINCKTFATLTAGCNCADLRTIVNEAAILAVREKARCVSANHLERAISKSKRK